MPSNPVKLMVTGPSSSAPTYAAGYPMWMPDTTENPFNVSIACEVSGLATFNIEHSFDYNGANPAQFCGWLSSAATWFQHSTISGATGSITGNYTAPVSAVRLNVTSGSGTVVAEFIQAG